MVLHSQSIRIRLFRQQPHRVDAYIDAALRFDFCTIHCKMDIQCCKSIIYGIGQSLLCCFISFTSLFQQFCRKHRIVRQCTFRSIYHNSKPVVRVDITIICIISIRDLSAFRQNHIQISLLRSFLRTLTFFTVNVLLHPTGQFLRLKAGIGVSMFWNVALLLHRDSGQNQRICSTEHHDCRQTYYNLMPPLLTSSLLHILIRILKDILFHSSPPSSLFQHSYLITFQT